ncbi:MAG: PAS domain-containing protein [Deltaproteobacteria bacterium]|nr:PAS domain-containing protein [Deltaproteobacteria bacterium]
MPDGPKSPDMNALRQALREARAQNASLEEDILKLRAELRQRDDHEQTLGRRLHNLESLLVNARDFALYRLAANPDNTDRSRVIFASRSFSEITCARDPLDQDTWFQVIHPDDQELVLQAQRNSADNGLFEVEFRIFHPGKGEWRWLHVLANGGLDPDGKPHLFDGVVQDVTPRKRAELELARYRDHLEELVAARTRELECEVAERQRRELELSAALAAKEVLLREVHHRVKNNLQSIAGLLDLQALHGATDLVADSFQDCRDRVRAMCLIHQQLYQADDLALVALGPYLENLAASLFRAYGAGERCPEFFHDAGDLCLDLDRGVACGLLFNELLSNTLKHAFPRGGPGRVTVLAHLSGRETVEIIFADNGVGLPPGLDLDTVPSLGLRLVRLLAENQLGGRLEILPGPGAVFRLTFPRQVPPRKGTPALC